MHRSPDNRPSKLRVLLVGLPIIVLASLTTGTAGARYNPAEDLRSGQDSLFVPGQAIVRFEAGVDASERRAARSLAGVSFAKSIALPRTQVVNVEGPVADAVRRLERQPNVADAQPNYRYRALAPPPNDTRFGDLWGLHNTGQSVDGSPPGTPGIDVNALDAWDHGLGAGTVIAVADTGVDLTHPDLAPNLWANDDPPNGSDDDGNGFVDDLRGADFVDGDANPDDHQFHGTHVAGTAAAVAGNALGIAGAAPEAEIMAVRVLDGDGGGSTSGIADGIAYAAREGADVINLSLGGQSPGGDPVMSSAVDVADSLDAVVVAAAGNDGANNDSVFVSPCNLPQPNLICVAAVDQQGDLAAFSNRGATTVDVGAPGTDILSAKTDYEPVLSEGFESDIAGTWTLQSPWARTMEAESAGSWSLTDSPGADYANDASTVAFKTTGVSLVGRRGCRMHFDLMLDTEAGFDGLLAGVLIGGGELTEGFSGSSGGGFAPVELTIEPFDGNAEVKPVFLLQSDNSVTRDGAHVDQLELLCRAATYDPSSYHFFQGTSMAAPHVAGVAALVRAADPGAPDDHVVDALKAGVRPLASLSGVTTTGGLVDADASIDAARSIPNLPPGGGGGGGSGGGGGGGGGGGVVVAPPAKAALASAKSSIRVTSTGRFSYSFRAGAGLNGSAVFKTRKKATVSRRAHVTISRKSFGVPGNGRVTLRIKLSRKNLRILRRNRRLLLRVTVTVRNSAGSAVTRKNLTLRAPRR